MTKNNLKPYNSIYYYIYYLEVLRYGVPAVIKCMLTVEIFYCSAPRNYQFLSIVKRQVCRLIWGSTS
jgi:hypothetical protein